MLNEVVIDILALFPVFRGKALNFSFLSIMQNIVFRWVFFFFFFFGGIGVWTQALCHLSHTSSPIFSG
jgi:hypothetical protein